jgi:hypothetical protein
MHTVSVVTLILAWHSDNAHPVMLECGGLGARIRNGSQTIMGYKPNCVNQSQAEWALQPAGGYSNGYTNYSFILTHSADQVVIQTASNVTRLNNYESFPGLCGSDPSNPGRGLCKKCSTSLYAQMYDCTGNRSVPRNHCIFGVAGDGKSMATLLIGTSGNGLTVDYTSVEVDA